MADTLAVVEYIRKLEARVAALERLEGGGGGPGVGFNDSEGDPAAVANAADGTSTYAARRDHAHALADGAALAEILDDDGAGSGLDADKLDGQEGAAYLRVDGSNNMTGALGIGAAAPSPYHLYVYGTTPRQQFRAAGADQDMEIRFYDSAVALMGRLLFAGANASPNKYFGFINTAGDYLAFLSDLTKFVTAGGSELARIDSTGQWGFGVTAPQGKLHAHTGTGGFLFGSKTAITGTAQTIVPDGTGDATKQVFLLAVMSNGSAGGGTSNLLAVGGTANVTIGSDTYQFRVNANGSVDVRRTAGSNNGSAAYVLFWI